MRLAILVLAFALFFGAAYAQDDNGGGGGDNAPAPDQATQDGVATPSAAAAPTEQPTGGDLPDPFAMPASMDADASATAACADGSAAPCSAADEQISMYKRLFPTASQTSAPPVDLGAAKLGGYN